MLRFSGGGVWSWCMSVHVHDGEVRSVILLSWEKQKLIPEIKLSF